LTELQDALNRCGFADWTVISNDAILPEPTSMAVIFLAGTIAMRRPRRHE